MLSTLHRISTILGQAIKGSYYRRAFPLISRLFLKKRTGKQRKSRKYFLNQEIQQRAKNQERFLLRGIPHVGGKKTEKQETQKEEKKGEKKNGNQEIRDETLFDK